MAGDISGTKPRTFARSIRYPGDADALWTALIECGFIDDDGHGKQVVHDWSEHSDNSVHQCLKKRGESFADGAKPFSRLKKTPVEPESQPEEDDSQKVHEPVTNGLTQPLAPCPLPLAKEEITAAKTSARAEPADAAAESFMPGMLPVDLATERVRREWQAHLGIQAGQGGQGYSRQQAKAIAAAVRDQGLTEPQLFGCISALVGAGRRVIRPQDMRPPPDNPGSKAIPDDDRDACDRLYEALAREALNAAS